MLIPKRVKYRRQHRPTRRGVSKGGNTINFGDWGLQALEPAYICLLYTSPSPRDS